MLNLSAVQARVHEQRFGATMVRYESIACGNRGVRDPHEESAEEVYCHPEYVCR